jgi:hypothetical protein
MAGGAVPPSITAHSPRPEPGTGRRKERKDDTMKQKQQPKIKSNQGELVASKEVMDATRNKGGISVSLKLIYIVMFLLNVSVDCMCGV